MMVYHWSHFPPPPPNMESQKCWTGEVVHVHRPRAYIRSRPKPTERSNAASYCMAYYRKGLHTINLYIFPTDVAKKYFWGDRGRLQHFLPN